MEFQRIASGDRSAFEEAFRSFYRPLCAFAKTYLKDRDRAEDLVQELFVKLWNDRERLTVTTSLSSYLFTAVRNRCLNELEKVVRMRPLNENAHDTPDENGRDEEEHTWRSARVLAAIEALPEERRKVFKLSRNESLKYHEIAERLGISVKTVENQMGKALKTLREELADLAPVFVALSSTALGLAATLTVTLSFLSAAFHFHISQLSTFIPSGGI
ncbi:MAG: RNA polymerase sigma-70 factor [Flavobacteriales bacterium]